MGITRPLLAGLYSVVISPTGLLAESRRGPQAGKTGDPRSQNADKADLLRRVDDEDAG